MLRSNAAETSDIDCWSSKLCAEQEVVLYLGAGRHDEHNEPRPEFGHVEHKLVRQDVVLAEGRVEAHDEVLPLRKHPCSARICMRRCLPHARCAADSDGWCLSALRALQYITDRLSLLRL